MDEPTPDKGLIHHITSTTAVRSFSQHIRHRSFSRLSYMHGFTTCAVSAWYRHGLLTRRLHPYQRLIDSSFQNGFITASDLLNFNQGLNRQVYVLHSMSPHPRGLEGSPRDAQSHPHTATEL
jgi:hypothetical protein